MFRYSIRELILITTIIMLCIVVWLDKTKIEEMREAIRVRQELIFDLDKAIKSFRKELEECEIRSRD